jgi:hypothetical protein
MAEKIIIDKQEEKNIHDKLISRAAGFQDRPKTFVKISPYWLKQMKQINKEGPQNTETE